MLLFEVLRRIIARGDTTGVEEKIDIFYAIGKIDREQYQELSAMLEG